MVRSYFWKTDPSEITKSDPSETLISVFMGSVFIYFALHHLNIVTLAQNKSKCISLKSILKIKHPPLLTHQIYIFFTVDPSDFVQISPLRKPHPSPLSDIFWNGPVYRTLPFVQNQFSRLFMSSTVLWT